MSTFKTPKDQVAVRPLTVSCLEAHIEDIAEIYAFAVQNLLATVELVPPTVVEMSARITKIINAGYPAFVACNGVGRVVGYAYGNSFRNAPAFRPAMEHSIYVDHSFTGCGVGRKLLTALIEASITAGEFRQMIAVVEASQSASLAFHEAMGFCEVGRVRGIAYKHGQWCTAVFLQLALGEGDATPPGP
ncbi:MAG: GNAT family N-acetyltransferase [Hyphomicrobiaceae bacterium]